MYCILFGSVDATKKTAEASVVRARADETCEDGLREV